ncbi:MAG: hypothetical protein QG578_1582 [Thermodesulfobacteriota bacterium]|nr:hypothetical protein [Thermodesulfobacteriota bacterium]
MYYFKGRPALMRELFYAFEVKIFELFWINPERLYLNLKKEYATLFCRWKFSEECTAGKS